MDEPEIFYWSGTWIHANQLPLVDGRKTDVFEIRSDSSNHVLGLVQWHPRWRRFAYFPEEGTLYDNVCMRELADFCDQVTKMRAEARAKEKVG